MTWQIAVTLAVTLIVFFGFVRERIPPDITAFTGVSLLLLTGILSAGSLQSVFANSAPLTIAAMFILSSALDRTGVIASMGDWAARMAGTSWLRTMLFLMLPVMSLSAFINNTPVVVILTPVMLSLARQSSIAPTKLLIPLSFISIFGGTCTLLGTSTNLLVDGLVRERGLPGFGIFEISGIGLMMAAAGCLYLLIFGWWLLPNRAPAVDLEKKFRERRFVTDLLVPVQSSLVGKKLQDTALAKMKEADVIDVFRGSVAMKRALGNLTLAAGDRLLVESSREGVAILRDMEDVKTTLHTVSRTETKIIEAIVGPESRIADQAVSELDLARKFGVYLLAVHRQSTRLTRNFDALRLRVGDVLLLEGTEDGLARLATSTQFVNVSLPSLKPKRTEKGPLAVIILAGVVLSAALLDFSIASAAVIGATLVILTRCVDPDDAYNSIQWPILMLIYGMLAIGNALESTGAMAFLVRHLTDVVRELGPTAVLSVLYLLTSLLTEIMSNNAAAILLTPIAFGLADAVGVDPRPLVVAVMLAGSASFATPIGYQTNTFVYRAGNYRFVDFIKVGLPLNLLLWAVATFAVPVFWPF